MKEYHTLFTTFMYKYAIALTAKSQKL